MENFAQGPLAISIFGGADSDNELPFPNPRNPFVQAGASFTDLGEIPPALQFPNPFDEGRAYPHSLERENAIEGGVIQGEGSFRCFPLAINVSSGADSSHNNHLLENMGEASHALPSLNLFDHAESSSTNSFFLEKQSRIDDGMVQVEGSCRLISLDEVLIATNDFDDALVVGIGGFGKVYKGFISDGATNTVVAIKRLNAQSNQGAEEFWTEVTFLSKFHHTNLVSLIGYCNENQEMILVYQYLALGTLADHLYKSSREESGRSISHLTWAQRLKICLGAAQGLDYLHTGTEIHIIHRDVKSTNILLDKNWIAKVSDFGICKCITSQTTTHVSTKVKATKGYWDPDYIYTGRVTRKSDVYAFGVVLLEVLCGRPPLDYRVEEEQISLILWVKDHIEKGKLDQIIDPSLIGETTPQSLKLFAKLANDCLRTKPKERPTMSEVVEILQNTLALDERKVRSGGTITKAFQGIKLVPTHMNRWWRKGKGSSLADLTQLVYPRFSLAKIRAATNNFNGLLIDKDSVSKFYKGRMMGETLDVMIKRFNSREWLEEFSAGIQVHSLIRHPNIVSLIGICTEKHELILVYEYMVNGTLRSRLHETYNDPILWKKRLEICIDTARGLEYLHTNVEEQFVHRDIKPSKVFLDNEWVAKIGNFELALPIPTGMATEGVETPAAGTWGYLDPEYFLTGKVTQKADVYSFGVMLLEVLCAKTLWDPDRDRDENLLVQRFRFSIERGNIDEVIDPHLIGKIAPECFRHYVNIALSCTLMEGIRRPSMNDVLRGLQSSLQMQESWENSIEMGDELHTANVPRSYNDVISINSEFTIGGQSYLISDLVRPWRWPTPGDISSSSEDEL